MTGLSFQDRPMQKANPYAIIEELEVILTDMKQAVAAHEASTFKRLEHEATVMLTRANIESIDLETMDLIEPARILR
ncbi:hypothetical protein [Pontibacter mucosus]|nr:hypothetical protein [Pontibacter mucosus]